MAWSLSTILPVATIWATLTAYTVAELGRAHVGPVRGHRGVRGIWCCACRLYFGARRIGVPVLEQLEPRGSVCTYICDVGGRCRLPHLGRRDLRELRPVTRAVARRGSVAVQPHRCPMKRARLGLSSPFGAIFLFMIINGAVVFVAGPMRWVGAGLVSALLVAWRRPLRPHPAAR